MLASSLYSRFCSLYTSTYSAYININCTKTCCCLVHWCLFCIILTRDLSLPGCRFTWIFKISNINCGQSNAVKDANHNKYEIWRFVFCATLYPTHGSSIHSLEWKFKNSSVLRLKWILPTSAIGNMEDSNENTPVIYYWDLKVNTGSTVVFWLTEAPGREDEPPKLVSCMDTMQLKELRR